MEGFLLRGASWATPPETGDAAADLILKIIGVNALQEEEVGNAIAIVRGAFQNPDRIPVAARNPAAARQLLQRLARMTNQPALQRQIAETLAGLPAR
jgi:hypothetical protein